MLTQPGQQAFLLRAGMAAAGDHGHRFTRRWRVAHADRHHCITVRTPGAQPCTTVVATATGGHGHHAEHHATLLDQRDVDGELFTAGNKFLGAIQRVDQPPARPAGTHTLRDIGVFFRQHRDARVQCGQAIEQNMMGGQVSGGYRRIIGLGGDFNAGTPERQDRVASGMGQFDHAFKQGMGQTAHGWNTPRWVSRSRARYSAARARPSLNCGLSTRLDSSRRFTRSTRIGSGSSPSRCSS